MIYLIGGASRCGKTMLANTLRAREPGTHSLSGDSFRQVLKAARLLHSPYRYSNDNPATYIDFYRHNTSQALSDYTAQCELIWPLLKTYLQSLHHETTSSCIIDSINILPEFLDDLSLPYKAVFLVDTNHRHWQRIVSHPDPHNWMNNQKLSLDQLQAWVYFNTTRSRHLIESCNSRSQRYVDLADTPFEVAQSRALELLLMK